MESNVDDSKGGKNPRGLGMSTVQLQQDGKVGGTWHGKQVKQDGNIGRPAGRVREASHSAILAVVGVHTKHVRPL